MIIIILIRCKRSTEAIIVKTKTKAIIIMIKLFIITEKVGIIETYRKIIKRNIFTILLIILIRYKRSAEVVIIKTKTKTIIIIIVNYS